MQTFWKFVKKKSELPCELSSMPATQKDFLWIAAITDGVNFFSVAVACLGVIGNFFVFSGRLTNERPEPVDCSPELRNCLTTIFRVLFGISVKSSTHSSMP